MRKRSEINTTETESPPEEPKKPVAPITFDSANRAKESTLTGDFERIVEKVLTLDNADATYDELEKALRIGEKRSEPGMILQALDTAEVNARKAHRLWMLARIEREKWELDNEVIFSAMRTEATKALQREKDQGLRSKQITDADVASMCATLYPDEYRHQEVKRKRVEAMVKSMEHLSEVWLSRCRSLQAMLTRQR